MTISPDDLIFLDLLGYIGYCLLAIGMFYIAQDKHIGWSYRFVGESIWIFISYQIGLTSGIVFGGIFLFIDTWAMLKIGTPTDESD